MTTAARSGVTGTRATNALNGPVWMAAYLALACAATVGALWFTGAAQPSILADPGAVVRWGLPPMRAVADLAQCLTIGLLVLACIALPTSKRKAYAPALRVASLTAGVWAVAMLVVAILTYADVSGQSMSDPAYGEQLASFLREIDLGRGIAITALIAALIATLAAGATTIGNTGLLLLLSAVSLIPPALAGHASGNSDHETAVTSLGLHLFGVTIWVGGLAGLVWLRQGLSLRELGTAVQRYSYLAAWSFGLVAVSGTINGWVRIGGLSGLGTRYGVLLLAKVAALVALGVMGWRHREQTIPAIAAGKSWAFARLATVEVGVMAVAVGLGVALSRSAPPVPAVPAKVPSMAQVLTGYPLPPAPSLRNYFTQWQPDILWLTLGGLGVVLYIVGVRRLHQRGDRWPIGRTICWFFGLAVLTYVTSGPPMAYGRIQFSAHMIAHMTIGMVVPIFLVLGAPVTLALRTLHPRRDGSRGAREWLLATVECKWMRFLSNPVVVAINFGFSLSFFYYSNLFRLSLTTHVGHELMHVHFLFAGYLLSWLMIGVDPGPNRPSYPLRMVTMFVTLSFHSFFGISLMMSNRILAPDFFGAIGRTWGGSLLEDQKLGGGIAWGIGELPTLCLLLILAVQWTRTDDREARRRDRAADRDGDAELKAYNAMLAGLAAGDTRRAAADHSSGAANGAESSAEPASEPASGRAAAKEPSGSTAPD
jgi:cytochrome c oxidase assembly factor CtaG/putative copper export protein